MASVRSWRGAIAALATVLVSCGCAPQLASPVVVPTMGASTPPDGGTSALDCGTGWCPAAPASPALYRGQLLAYATHGFDEHDLAAVRQQMKGPVTAVWATEQMVRSDKPAYPLTPVATLLAEPAQYAAAVGQPGMAEQLARGMVLAQTESRLRQARLGSSVTLSDGTALRVTAIVPDQELGGFEMATSVALLSPAPAQPASYLLVGGRPSVGALLRALHRQLPGRPIRVEAPTGTGVPGVYDDELSQLQMKRRFGEFSVKAGSDGTLVPDSSWTGHWIGTANIKVLGQVKCNKAILPELAAAMDDLEAAGLSALVDSKDFRREGGCWDPRTTSTSEGTLSAHTWGIAVDINVTANPVGAKPHQDPRLVAIMAAHGFTWGGKWLRPEGAHFEWLADGLREPAANCCA